MELSISIYALTYNLNHRDTYSIPFKCHDIYRATKRRILHFHDPVSEGNIKILGKSEVKFMWNI